MLDVVEWEHQKHPDHRCKQYAMVSGQGVGKTALMSGLQGWRSLRRRSGLGVHTSPTGRQNREAFLAEMRMMVEEGDPILSQVFTFLHDRAMIFGSKTWGITTMTAQRGVDLQGIHRENLTATIDEAAGVDPIVVQQFQGTLSNADSMLLLAGNPNTRQSPLYNAIHGEHRSMWHRFRFNAEDCPIADHARNARIAEEFGRDSDVYRIRVLGLFPHGNPAAVISPEQLDRSMRKYSGEEYMEYLPLPGFKFQHQFGIDFAWLGDNESVIGYRKNRKVSINPFMGKTPEQITNIAVQMQLERGISDEECIFVGDSSGPGKQELLRLRKMGKNVHMFYNGAPSTKRKSNYKDKITQAWFGFADLLREGLIATQDDDMMKDQLTSRDYEIEDSTGLVKVVAKTKHTGRGWPSPDRAEAALYACFKDNSSVVQGVFIQHTVGDSRRAS